MIDLYAKENKVKNFTKKHFAFIYDIHSIFYFVLLLIAVSFLFYGLIIINNNFMTPFSGDFVMQYIPFAYNYYDDWYSFFRTGVFPLWDSNVYLGADSITSNGYYIMFSPFFIPLLLFPRNWIPVMLTFISVLRLVLAGVFCRLYLKKFGIQEKYARLGAIAYAFCGWMAFYQWFNNFLDIVTFLPLILLGAELILREKKPWVLMISLGLLGIDNFFFFPATCILVALYCVFRFFQRVKMNTGKDNGLIILIGIGAFLVAVMLASSVFLPGLITGYNDPKVSSVSYIGKLKAALENHDIGEFFGTLFFWEKATYKGNYWRVYYPIIEMFFPVTTCRNLGVLNVSGDVNNAGSLWVATPVMFFMLPAIIQSVKDKHYSVLVAIVLICLALFTPALYFLLFGGAKVYTRWLIIFPPLMIAFTMKYLSDHEKDITVKTLFTGYLYIMAGITLMIIFCELIIKEVQTGVKYMVPFPLCVVIEIIYVTGLFLFYAFIFQKKFFANAMTYVACLEAVAMGTFVALGHSWTNLDQNQIGNLEENNRVYETMKRVNEADDSFFRTYVKFNGSDWNNQNHNNYNGAGFFNTLYNFNTQRFKWWSNITQGPGSWSGYYPTKRQNLDAFLNFQYYLIDKRDIRDLPDYRPNLPLHYELNEELSDDNYAVYKDSTNQINLGYSFDTVSMYKKDSSITSGLGSGVTYTPQAIANDENFMTRAIMMAEDYEELPVEVKDDLNVEKYLNLNTMTPTCISDKNFVYEYSTLKYDYGPNGEYGDEWKHLIYDKNKGGYDVLNDLYKVINTNHTSIHGNDRTLITLTKRFNNGDYTAQDYFDNPDNAFEGFNNGTTIYIQAPFKYENRVDVYLLGKNGKVLTYDNHGDNLKEADFLQMRGYYAKEEVYAIVFYLRNGGEGANFTTYVEPYSAYQDRMAELSKYPLTDVKYVDFNTFSFKTNYEKHRMVVTNIPYETGWKVKAISSDGTEKAVKTYLTTGGFVGFVSELGDTQYIMKYANDASVFGEIFTRIALVIIVSTYFAYVYIDFRKKYYYTERYLGL